MIVQSIDMYESIRQTVLSTYVNSLGEIEERHKETTIKRKIRFSLVSIASEGSRRLRILSNV